MTAVLISLAASVLWGGADFTGGLLTKRHQVLAVVAGVEAVGLVVFLALAALGGESPPGIGDLAVAAAAGCSGVTGLAFFYRALAIGTMSIVAPISSCGAAIPAVYGVATGDPVSAVLGVGLAVAMTGVILASLEAEHEGVEEVRAGRGSRLSLVFAGFAAVGFGGYFVLFDQVADVSVVWSLVAARVVPVAIIAAVLLVIRPPFPRGGDSGLLLLAGLSDAGATALYGVALTKGALSAVSVVGALYPVTTVLLARGILGERVRRVQEVGIALALTGVALIAAG